MPAAIDSRRPGPLVESATRSEPPGATATSPVGAGVCPGSAGGMGSKFGAEVGSSRKLGGKAAP